MAASTFPSARPSQGEGRKKFALAAREQAALNFLGGAADACDSQEISLAGILLDGRQKVKSFEEVATKRRFGALAGGLGEARRRLEPRRRPVEICYRTLLPSWCHVPRV